MINGKKVGLYIIVAVVLVAAVTASFLLGRGRNTASEIKSLKETITSSLERERELEESLGRERELVEEMAGSFAGIKSGVERVQGLWENISVRIDELDEALTAQREIVSILAELDRRTGESVDVVEVGLNSSIGLVDSLIEDLSTGYD